MINLDVRRPSMRKTPLVNNQIYHVFNRGVDRRNVFLGKYDLDRFLLCLSEFNNLEPIGSIYEQSFRKKGDSGASSLGRPTSKLVEVVAYCLNPNHFHLILQQKTEGGISEFMKRLLGGYTKYFNLKNERTGALFQGKFKAVHINNDNYLYHLSTYVNLNNQVHKIKTGYCSSWEEYMGKEGLCDKTMILSHFPGIEAYEKFALEQLQKTLETRGEINDFEFEKPKKSLRRSLGRRTSK